MRWVCRAERSANIARERVRSQKWLGWHCADLTEPVTPDEAAPAAFRMLTLQQKLSHSLVRRFCNKPVPPGGAGQSVAARGAGAAAVRVSGKPLDAGSGPA